MDACGLAQAAPGRTLGGSQALWGCGHRGFADGAHRQRGRRSSRTRWRLLCVHAPPTHGEDNDEEDENGDYSPTRTVAASSSREAVYFLKSEDVPDCDDDEDKDKEATKEEAVNDFRNSVQASLESIGRPLVENPSGWLENIKLL